jgi:hypothetical protein
VPNCTQDSKGIEEGAGTGIELNIRPEAMPELPASKVMSAKSQGTLEAMLDSKVM